MITLSANTSAMIVSKTERNRYYIVGSDSTTITRLSGSQYAIDESTTAGTGITCYYPRIVAVPANSELWAVSTGTPTIFADECDANGITVLRGN